MPEEAPPTVVAIVGPPGVSYGMTRVRFLFVRRISNSRFICANIGRQDNSRQVASPPLYQADT